MNAINTKQWVWILLLTVTWQLLAVTTTLQASSCDSELSLSLVNHNDCQLDKHTSMASTAHLKAIQGDHRCVDCNHCTTSCSTALVNQPSLVWLPELTLNYPPDITRFTSENLERLFRPPILLSLI